jgi:hypothetical protein
MASAMMMERTGMGGPAVTTPGLGTHPGMQTSTNWLVVPRCTFKVEPCQGGLRITCACEDKVACGMVQNLCTALQGGLCTCCTMMNGQVVYSCHLTMGLCRCENTKDGVCVTCTSGDQKCAEMIQACCNCLSAMLKAGCTCCLMMNNTPVCCGCC